MTRAKKHSFCEQLTSSHQQKLTAEFASIIKSPNEENVAIYQRFLEQQKLAKLNDKKAFVEG